MQTCLICGNQRRQIMIRQDHGNTCWKRRNVIGRFFGRLFCDHDWNGNTPIRFSHVLSLFAHSGSLAARRYLSRWREDCPKCGASRLREKWGMD